MKTTDFRKIKVNDILVADMGCTMIMPVFFKVVRATPKTVWIKELKSKQISGDSFRGKCIPKDEFDNMDEEPKRCLILCDENEQYCKYKEYGSCTYCAIWSGEPMDYDYLD